MEDINKLKGMSKEDVQAELLDSISDAVRVFAHRLAMLKAISKEQNGIAPEDFDKDLEREYKREYDKVKDKSLHQLALIGLLEMATSGEDITKLFSIEEDD